MQREAILAAALFYIQSIVNNNMDQASTSCKRVRNPQPPLSVKRKKTSQPSRVLRCNDNSSEDDGESQGEHGGCDDVDGTSSPRSVASPDNGGGEYTPLQGPPPNRKGHTSVAVGSSSTMVVARSKPGQISSIPGLREIRSTFIANITPARFTIIRDDLFRKLVGLSIPIKIKNRTVI